MKTQTRKQKAKGPVKAKAAGKTETKVTVKPAAVDPATTAEPQKEMILKQFLSTNYSPTAKKIGADIIEEIGARINPDINNVLICIDGEAIINIPGAGSFRTQFKPFETQGINQLKLWVKGSIYPGTLQQFIPSKEKILMFCDWMPEPEKQIEYWEFIVEFYDKKISELEGHFIHEADFDGIETAKEIIAWAETKLKKLHSENEKANSGMQRDYKIESKKKITCPWPKGANKKTFYEACNKFKSDRVITQLDIEKHLGIKRKGFNYLNKTYDGWCFKENDKYKSTKKLLDDFKIFVQKRGDLNIEFK